MEYNKRKFVKSADHKVLHKVRKHWVTISVALLGLLGGAAATHVSVSANSTADQANRQLNSGQLPNHQTALQTNDQSNHSSQYGLSLQNTGRQPSTRIVQQASLLHNGILRHAMNGSAKTDDSNSEVSGPNSASATITSVSRGSVQDSVASPQTKSVKWGQTQIKFMSDGDHGNAGGDVAEVQPGAISDAFNEQNNSDTTYNSGNTDQSSYVVNRYQDALELPFDQNSNNWILKFAPQVTLPKNGGISKGDQTPRPGENSSDLDYEQNAYRTNDYQYLLSSVNRTLWNHFKVMDLTNLDTDNASDLSNMFNGDRSLQKVILNNSANPHLTNLQGMFASAPQLREVDFNHFGIGQVRNLDSLFMSDVRLNHLDLSSLDTSHVTDLHGAFMSDFALSDVRGLNTWNTSRVTNLISTFARDLALSKLNLNHWDTSQVTSMAGMFSGDSALRDLDLSNFQTGKVSDLSSMFAGDTQLRNLDLANFDTRNVKAIMPSFPVGGMSFMFNGDNNLQQLTLGARTALNRPNQNWGANFFDQNFDVNGHDTTDALRTGQQAPGTYYSADYYRNVLVFQQYFADEQELADQALADRNVQADPQIQHRVGQEASQINAMVKDDTARLTPASHAAKALDDVNHLASLTDLIGGQSSLASSVASSVAQSNRSAAAVRSADSSIAASYRASVTSSVAVKDRQIASSAASSADQKLAESMRDSVAQSVSMTNQSLALSAAQAADNRLAASYQSSVAKSVTISNQKLAASAARSADQSLAISLRASVDRSVASRNQSLANSAAQSADQSLVASMRTSVSNSVAANNRKLARSAAQSADHQITASYQASISNSVAFNDQRLAQLAARSADQKLAASYRASVADSVSSADRRAAISAQQSTNARLASSARASVSASVSVAGSQSVLASVSAQSASQSNSLSDSVKSAVAVASDRVFQSNLDQINSYDQDAGSYNQQARNDLNQLNVSANASLTALKDNDLNEVADDDQLIREDNEVVSNLVDNYNSAEPDDAIGSAASQLATAKDVAQDASLIITDDLTNLKSRASQAAASSSQRSQSSAGHSQSSSNRSRSNSAHRASSSANSVQPSSSDHHSSSAHHSTSPSASSSRAGSLRMSIESAIDSVLTEANDDAGQADRAVSNEAVETDPQASAAVNHDVQLIDRADQAIIIDQQRPDPSAELNADYKLNQIHSAASDTGLTVLSAEQASASASQAASLAAAISSHPISSSIPQSSSSQSLVPSSSSQPNWFSIASNRSSASSRQSASSLAELDALLQSLEAVPRVQNDSANENLNRASENPSSSGDVDRSASSSVSSHSASQSTSANSVSRSRSESRTAHSKVDRSVGSAAFPRRGRSLAGHQTGSNPDADNGTPGKSADDHGNGNGPTHQSTRSKAIDPDSPKSYPSVKPQDSANKQSEGAGQNSRSKTLPQTGDESPAGMMAIALLTLSALGMLIRRKRRQD